MADLIYLFDYVDFDNVLKTGRCKAHETRDGFYVVGLEGPQGCSKTMSPVVHWHPIREAIRSLLGGRALVAHWPAPPAPTL